MKIVVCSCEYPPFGGGGIGTYSWNMSRFLAEAGHDVHVICNSWVDYAARNPAFVKDFSRYPSLHVHSIDALSDKYSPRPPYDEHDNPIGQTCKRWDSSLFWSILAAGKLEEVVRDHGIEVVEYPECFAESFIAMRRRAAGLGHYDVPMTVTLHSPIHEVTRYNLYRMHEGWFQRRHMAEEYCIRQADMLSSPSASLVGIVQKRMGLDPREFPCEVIHNPMDFSSLPDIDIEVKDTDDAWTIFFAGRIEPRKGVKYLIDAVVPLVRKYPKLSVHLVGKDCDAGEAPGSMIPFLSDRIPDDCKPRIVFEGLKPRDEVLRRYAEATVCVFSPPWDNFPYTCCEAMSYGACVIASDYGGMAEMIEDGVSGLLFPTTDVPKLTETIERALNDRALRAKLRANAGPRIRQICDPALAVKKRIDHYEQTIERHKSKKRTLAPISMSKSSGKRVALFIPNHTSETAIRQTIRGAQIAAERASVQLEITIVGTKRHNTIDKPPYKVKLLNSGRESDGSALETFMSHIAAEPPDYFLAMWPSEQLGEEYFLLTEGLLRDNPKVAWATTWAESCHQGEQEPYAGYDFSVPLELMFYHAIPYCLMRYSAYQEAGGFNFDLPPGWRQWDLYLALHRHGYQGIVIPEWCGKFEPNGQIKLNIPEHGGTHEFTLSEIVRRNRDLFDAHWSEIWIANRSNPERIPAPINTSQNSEDDSKPKKKPSFAYRVVRFIRRRLAPS